MCEPSHSIVQYPDNDDQGNPTQNRLNLGFGKVMEFSKKILKWFHFSKMGAGHSEAIQISGAGSLILPDETKYEAFWWNREFHIDGLYYGHHFDKQVAYECAEQYAQIVSIGSLHAVRQFLETSFMKTDRPDGYLTRFQEDMINQKGRDSFYAKLRDFFKNNSIIKGRLRGAPQDVKRSLVKLILGFTRKRELLVPEWADDDRLWKPDQKGLPNKGHNLILTDGIN